jgi:hypothetical protein
MRTLVHRIRGFVAAVPRRSVYGAFTVENDAPACGGFAVFSEDAQRIPKSNRRACNKFAIL